MDHSIDDELLEQNLKGLVVKEREDLKGVIEHLAEFDRRRLAERKSYPSTFIYCTKVLGYSEQCAYKRVYAARLSRDYPLILPLLAEGRLHLSGLRAVGAYLTQENHGRLLEVACGRTQRELELLAAGLSGRRPEPKDTIKVFAAESEGCSLAASYGPLLLGGKGEVDRGSSAQTVAGGGAALGFPAGHGLPGGPIVVPAPPPDPEQGRVRFSFTGSTRLLGKVERARQILGHRFPGGRIEDLMEAAFDALLKSVDPERAAAVVPRRSQPRARRIPKWVRKTVWLRDGGRCTYVSKDGRRCDARSFLQFDHVIPWAVGGASNDPANIRLLCRAHNLLLARDIFGKADGAAGNPDEARGKPVGSEGASPRGKFRRGAWEHQEGVAAAVGHAGATGDILGSPIGVINGVQNADGLPC